VSEETFGARLRRERERRHIVLSSISANSKISVGYFEALERDDLSRWPSGIFRRAFIRAYAAGIGLDPEAIAREFVERFPDADRRPWLC
jgi:cytoskeletal protein RodZ